jgi:hypothetical protein
MWRDAAARSNGGGRTLRAVRVLLSFSREKRGSKMKPADFERVFDKTLPLSGTKTLTVTQVPDRLEDLLRLLGSAMIGGFGNQRRLTAIHLPMARFPDIDSKFWHVPVEDCGDSHVLRLFFETPDVSVH